ncbi:hypothetical protein [Aeromicrobium sp. 50.2.37]|nr:hypothetical protein [Aeromicrobium sp. 50.2.37]MCR4511743.1 hypothetical protein [Aeromicrobium sp. 50.2.37]
MSNQQRVTVSKAARNRAIRSALSTKTVRVVPMTNSQRRAADGKVSK